MNSAPLLSPTPRQTAVLTTDDGPRILQIVDNLEIGGAQEVVRTLAEHLAAAGCYVAICALRDGPLRDGFEAAGIPVFLLPERHSAIINPLTFAAEMARLRRELVELIDGLHIGVVQTHLLRSLDFLILSLKFGRDVKVYWTFHNTNFDLRRDHLTRHRWLLGPKRQAHHLLYVLGASKADGLIAVSPEVKSSIRTTISGIPTEKIAVIPNGVDTRRYQRHIERRPARARIGLRDADRAIAVVATFKEQKGHRFLIDAAAILSPDFPFVRFLLIGDGELRADLEHRIAAHGLGNQFLLLGMRPDVPELLAAADLFVLPSLWEGLPMALVEAMAAGLPVVATEVSGTRGVMVDGETGLLVPPGDAFALARAIAALLVDPNRAAAMGAAARRRIETHYGARRQAADHLSLFAPDGFFPGPAISS
jgi:glycosyltransferase involved in cell wall biosynthesis